MALSLRNKEGVCRTWKWSILKSTACPCQCPQDSTILEAARYAGIDIPTLCYLKDINEIGACRICVVEVEGRKDPGYRLRLSG